MKLLICLEIKLSLYAETYSFPSDIQERAGDPWVRLHWQYMREEVNCFLHLGLPGTNERPVPDRKWWGRAKDIYTYIHSMCARVYTYVHIYIHSRYIYMCVCIYKNNYIHTHTHSFKLQKHYRLNRVFEDHLGASHHLFQEVPHIQETTQYIVSFTLKLGIISW